MQVEKGKPNPLPPFIVGTTKAVVRMERYGITVFFYMCGTEKCLIKRKR